MEIGAESPRYQGLPFIDNPQSICYKANQLLFEIKAFQRDYPGGEVMTRQN